MEFAYHTNFGRGNMYQTGCLQLQFFPKSYWAKLAYTGPYLNQPLLTMIRPP